MSYVLYSEKMGWYVSDRKSTGHFYVNDKRQARRWESASEAREHRDELEPDCRLMED